MTPTIVRVMLSLALVPLVPWLYIEVYWILDRHSSLGDGPWATLRSPP